ncbi:MAG TPA: expansin-like protein [Polyangia bacterium]|nr:expansin-like protein [Polyangia bacterium]
MAFLGAAWVGCKSGTDVPTCQGGPGEEYCACQAGGICNSGLTCATDLQQCVHLAGTPLPSSGGSTGSGGAASGTGGQVVISSGGGGTGGERATGGTAGSVSSTGGHAGAGGAAGGPGGGGMAAGGVSGSMGNTGIAGATACGTLMPSASGNGEFTHYNFGQGTSKGELGMYQTACGYLGSESGQTDTVTNIANMSPAKNTYFAAIPGNSSQDFNTSGNCGACVQISNAGHTIIATIIDECPENSNPVCKNNANGELDLSVDAFNQLGFGNGNPSGTSWKVVPCPVTGNVVVRIKQPNELYIENVILALKSVSGPGGSASRTFYGSWHFNANINTAGTQLTLTDAANRTIQVTLTSGSADQNQDMGVQFPKCE